MFLGGANLNLDSKGRIAVPAKYRHTLQDCCASRVVITVNPRAECLWLYPENQWQQIEQRVMALPTFKGPNSDMQRMLLGFANKVDMDGQGRVLLTPQQRAYAKLDKRITVMGLGNKCEIWDEDRLEAHMLGVQEQAQDKGSELSEELESLVL